MNDKADFLHGVGAIANYMGLRERQARTLCENGTIPTFRPVDVPEGKATRTAICARKSA